MTSPLRYPVGKTRAVKLLWALLQKEYPNTERLISPFFGGGSFELKCAERGIKVYGNDKFCHLANFWTQLKENPAELAQTVELIRPLSKSEFYRLRVSIESETNVLLRAAYYFAINRCSFSGATFCGGFSQEAADKRFTESSIERLKTTNTKNIQSISNLDVLDMIAHYPDDVLFLDPPYYIENYLYGRDGDTQIFDHSSLAKTLHTRKKWMLCYNDCPYIRDLYNDCRIVKLHWTYGMTTKESSEIVIFPAL